MARAAPVPAARQARAATTTLCGEQTAAAGGSYIARAAGAGGFS